MHPSDTWSYLFMDIETILCAVSTLSIVAALSTCSTHYMVHIELRGEGYTTRKFLTFMGAEAFMASTDLDWKSYTVEAV